MAMNDYSDNDYWKALAERFFEAGTSEVPARDSFPKRAEDNSERI